MKQLMMLVVLVGSFWVGQVWADMDRVSVVGKQLHIHFSVASKSNTGV